MRSSQTALPTTCCCLRKPEVFISWNAFQPQHGVGVASGHHHIDFATIQRFALTLQKCLELRSETVPQNPSGADHDNLQAIVAALPAAGLTGGPCRAIPNGIPARYIAARNRTPAHRVEGIIWDATPLTNLPHLPIRRTVKPTVAPPSLPSTSGESTRIDLMPSEDGIARGVRLFEFLVNAARHGDATGIAYGGFIAYLHGVKTFVQIAGRPYRSSDTEIVIRAAAMVTNAAGGRRKIGHSAC